MKDNVLPVPCQYANPISALQIWTEPADNPAMRREKPGSILESVRIRVRMWLDQRSKRRECFRRHRLMLNAARRLR